MTEFRKQAWFELSVCLASSLAVIGLYAWSRNPLASIAGFSLLALLGFRVLFRRGASPVQDERDEAIHHRATLIGYVVLWIGLVLWGVVVPMRFADVGSVPIAWVAPVVWVAAWLLMGTRSIAILVLDRQEV